MDKISETLGSATSIYEIVETKACDNGKGDIVYEEDHDNIEYSKKNIKKIIDTGMQALPDMLRVLRDTDNPKMYSSASSFMESLAKINKQYAEIQQPKQQNTSIQQPSNISQINNNYYMNATDILESIDDEE